MIKDTQLSKKDQLKNRAITTICPDLLSIMAAR
jgi:hypothetical protein